MKNMQEHREDFRYRPAEVGKMVEVRVTYIKASDVRRRGVYLVVQPMEVVQDQGTGYSGETFMIFSGFQVFLEQTARKNPKLVKAGAELVDEWVPEIARRFGVAGRDATKAFVMAELEEIFAKRGEGRA